MELNKDQALILVRDMPVEIGHIVGFKDLTGLHNDWLRSFLLSKEDQTLLAHRGSYKTTVLSLFIAIHTVVVPNETVTFFRKTDTDVTEVIRQAKKIISSDIMQMISLAFYGCEVVHTNDSSYCINTNLNNSVSGTNQVNGLGIKTSITGKHSDIVITDDIVNIKDRTSKAEREETKRQYQELQNIKNRNGRFINTGTPWHKDDAISLMPNVKKYDCYQTGLMTEQDIARLKATMSDSLFAANYRLKHILSEKALFTNPKYTDQNQLIYNGVGHIDAGYDGEDYTAYTAMKFLPDGRIIAFGALWDKHVDDCIKDIKIYQEKYRVGTVSCEKNADKGYLAKELRKNGIYAVTYSESQNKYVKIATHLKGSWNDIYWIKDTDPDYIEMILDYSEFAEHDDAPDSAASLIRKNVNKVKYNPVRGGI